MFFSLITVIGLCVFFIRRHREHRLSAVFLAKQELEKIKNSYRENQNKSELVQELSTLIRRVSISVCKRSDIASLTGQEWLMFLDRFTNNNEFSQGIGRVLVEAPYQGSPDYDSTGLLELISKWIDSVSNNRGKTVHD